MTIYILALFTSIIFTKYSIEQKNDYMITLKRRFICISPNFKFCILSMLPLAIVSGIRYGVGSDYFGTYVSIFNSIKTGHAIRDNGFGFIVKACTLVSNDYVFMFLIISLITSLFIYLSIYEQSDSLVLSVLLYFITSQYFITMNMVRQSLATAIFLYSLKYLKKDDYLKYSLFIIAASTIHTSALLYFLLLIYRIIYRHRNKFYLVFILLFLFSGQISSVIQKIIIGVPFLRNHFAWYFNSAYNSGNFNTISFLIQMSVLMLMLYCCYKKEGEEIKLYITMQILGIMFALLSQSLPLARRMSYLFTFANILYIPYCLKLLNNKRVYIILCAAVIACFSVYTWITAVNMGYNDILPYKTFLSR